MQRRTVRLIVAITTAALAVSIATPVYAETPTPPPPIPVLTGAELSASWTAPLSTRGRYIVDANGNRFKLKSANWDGAQGHWNGTEPKSDPANYNSGVSYDIPMGLDRVPMATLMADFHQVGINSIRLPFSNEMLGMTAPVPDAAVLANPQLMGKTPLQIFDAVVAALTADGFAVILNNHSTTSRWCCGENDGNSKPHSSQTLDKFVSDWAFLAARYVNNPRVAGMDLRNEVRRDITDDPNWGMGDANDLYKAYQLAAVAIQKVNPNTLIVMEGINWQGIPIDGFFHERPNLRPVATTSNTILYPDKLVYSSHVYGFTGPNHTGATGLGETHDPRYRDMTATELAAAVTAESLFVTTSGQHYTAPVWLSEFGTTGAGQDNPKEIAWWDNFIDVLVANDTDFAVWPLVTHATEAGVFSDKFALIGYSPTGTKFSIADDWRYPAWSKLVTAPGKSGPVATQPRWNMLGSGATSPDNNSSLRAQGTDWDSGQWKGNCPDSERLIGLSRSSNRALCTNNAQPATSSTHTIVSTEATVTHDWAGGYTKLQCPAGQIATGYSVNPGVTNKWAMSKLYCSQSTDALPSSQGRTLWFDQGDNRPAGGGSTGSDWAPGKYKGQCNNNEYIAGVAYTYRWNNGGVPSGLLCKPLA